mmetsp:Transcript_26105/g.84004  ORF Transcript_26105/g.84004 Transcript_26105/m.84004 type:complete len:210 (+) Transcript_26105:604-1233(+)
MYRRILLHARTFSGLRRSMYPVSLPAAVLSRSQADRSLRCRARTGLWTVENIFHERLMCANCTNMRTSTADRPEVHSIPTIMYSSVMNPSTPLGMNFLHSCLMSEERTRMTFGSTAKPTLSTTVNVHHMTRPPWFSSCRYANSIKPRRPDRRERRLFERIISLRVLSRSMALIRLSLPDSKSRHTTAQLRTSTASLCRLNVPGRMVRAL